MRLFTRHNSEAGNVGHLERVEALLRDRFGLAEDRLVLVSEANADLPGAPSRMTTMLFWTGDRTRHRIAVYKPAAEITGDDLPAGWLRGALRDEGTPDCC